MKLPLLVAFWAALCPLATAGLDNPVVEPLDVQESYARGGDPGAMFNLGLAHFRGEGVPKDQAKGFAFFKAAAERSYPGAEYNLALCYLYGTGVAKDDKAAAKWGYAAARQGILPAQTLMVQCYLTGTGVERSMAKALTWDFIARRTLQLQKGVNLGAPPAPGQVRSDGAVEQTEAGGRKVWIHPDKSRETLDADGTRRIVRAGGMLTLIYPDGARETRMATGDTEWKLPDGTQILVSPGGATQARFVDGRIESKDGFGGEQVLFPDGAKTTEGPAATNTGEAVRVRESYDAKGELTSKRVLYADKSMEVMPDGSFNIEFAGEDAEGLPLTLVESYDEKGQPTGRELVKPDGTRREGSEEWTIVRWYREGNQRVHARETYGLGGSVVKSDELKREPAPPLVKAAPTPARPAKITFIIPPPLGLPVRSAGGSAAPAGQDPEVTRTTEALQQLEITARNFAGVTDAEYKVAQAQGAQYVIAYDNPPQKSDLNWMKFKSAQLVAPQPRLQEIPSDLSKKYPLGLNGQEAMKALPWKHAESDHFVVHFTELSTAAPVMNYIENAYCVVVQLLQVEEARGAAKSHVFVFPDQAEWNEWLRKHNLPSAVAGYAYKGELLFGAGQEKDDYVKTICHEATHAIVARYYPGRRLPLWLNEGLAEYAAAKAVALKRGQKLQKYLSTGAVQRDLRPVFARTGYQAAAPTTGRSARGEDPANLEALRTFYRTSERAVMALNEKVEKANFPKFLNLLAAGNPADLALKLTFGAACDSPEALAKLLDL